MDQKHVFQSLDTKDGIHVVGLKFYKWDVFTALQNALKGEFEQEEQEEREEGEEGAEPK